MHPKTVSTSKEIDRMRPAGADPGTATNGPVIASLHQPYGRPPGGNT